MPRNNSQKKEDWNKFEKINQFVTRHTDEIKQFIDSPKVKEKIGNTNEPFYSLIKARPSPQSSFNIYILTHRLKKPSEGSSGNTKYAYKVIKNGNTFQLDQNRYFVKDHRNQLCSDTFSLTLNKNYHALDRPLLKAEKSELLTIRSKKTKKQYLVTEDFGINLFELIYQNNNLIAGLSLKQRIDACKQIAQQLKKIHNKGYIHSDLKPQNLMIKIRPEKEGKQKLIATIIDFDLSRQIKKQLGKERRQSIGGTPSYFPPEGRIGSTKSDIYGLIFLFFPFLKNTLVHIEDKQLYFVPFADLPRFDDKTLNQIEILFKKLQEKKQSNRPNIKTVIKLLEKIEKLVNLNEHSEEKCLNKSSNSRSFNHIDPPPSDKKLSDNPENNHCNTMLTDQSLSSHYVNNSLSNLFTLISQPTEPAKNNNNEHAKKNTTVEKILDLLYQIFNAFFLIRFFNYFYYQSNENTNNTQNQPTCQDNNSETKNSPKR